MNKQKWKVAKEIKRKRKGKEKERKRKLKTVKTIE